MHLSTQQLKQIIKEELRKVLLESADLPPRWNEFSDEQKDLYLQTMIQGHDPVDLAIAGEEGRQMAHTKFKDKFGMSQADRRIWRKTSCYKYIKQLEKLEKSYLDRDLIRMFQQKGRDEYYNHMIKFYKKYRQIMMEAMGNFNFIGGKWLCAHLEVEPKYTIKEIDRHLKDMQKELMKLAKKGPISVWI
jgi:hypothetical protein